MSAVINIFNAAAHMIFLARKFQCFWQNSFFPSDTTSDEKTDKLTGRNMSLQFGIPQLFLIIEEMGKLFGLNCLQVWLKYFVRAAG